MYTFLKCHLREEKKVCRAILRPQMQCVYLRSKYWVFQGGGCNEWRLGQHPDPPARVAQWNRKGLLWWNPALPFVCDWRIDWSFTLRLSFSKKAKKKRETALLVTFLHRSQNRQKWQMRKGSRNYWRAYFKYRLSQYIPNICSSISLFYF